LIQIDLDALTPTENGGKINQKSDWTTRILMIFGGYSQVFTLRAQKKYFEHSEIFSSKNKSISKKSSTFAPIFNPRE